VVGEEGCWRSEENTFVESLKMSVCHYIGGEHVVEVVISRWIGSNPKIQILSDV
jgi:hypothetical protein